ncbi:MAG: restriction endonuclease [Bryobacteraceae bacterium]
MDEAFRKGDQLERDVRAIEETILQGSPALRYGTFTIESKRIFVRDGVKHEIDLWVSVGFGNDYDSLFIFECKNWEEKVGKNDIIIFSEKIAVSSAQKGFFVAKSFTKDALAQAAKDTRVELLTVADLPTQSLPTPYDFHFLVMDKAHIDLTFKERGRLLSDKPRQRLIVTSVERRGQTINLRELSQEWVVQIWGERSRTIPSGTMEAGLYPVVAEGQMFFEPNQLIADGRDMEQVLYVCNFTARVERPAIVSCFDVKSRGRSIELAPVKLGEASLQCNIHPNRAARVETR